MTNKEMERQDDVDNTIFNMCEQFAREFDKELDFDIEYVGRIRDAISDYLYNQNVIENAEQFYP